MKGISDRWTSDPATKSISNVSPVCTPWILIVWPGWILAPSSRDKKGMACKRTAPTFSDLNICCKHYKIFGSVPQKCDYTPFILNNNPMKYLCWPLYDLAGHLIMLTKKYAGQVTPNQRDRCVPYLNNLFTTTVPLSRL
uniref:Uncharacterized protein n=1 Tax=Romanomermis culicivorax TaxID=13658 RepID=A0A915J9Q7_ROMCU